jgi:hypothetical protein
MYTNLGTIAVPVENTVELSSVRLSWIINCLVDHDNKLATIKVEKPF